MSNNIPACYSHCKNTLPALKTENRIIQTAANILRLFCFILCFVGISTGSTVFARQAPVCPGAESAAPYPAYAPVGDQPATGTVSYTHLTLPTIYSV